MIMIWERITGDMGSSNSAFCKEVIGKEGKYLFFVEKKKREEGKGGKYLEKGNIFLWRKRKTEKKKAENIWRWKIFSIEETKNGGGKE